jgi:hypothetical protein
MEGKLQHTGPIQALIERRQPIGRQGSGCNGGR